MNNKPRITVRVTPYQLQVLEELKKALNCNVSLIIRAIIGDFLNKNEETLERIIDGSQEFDKNWINDYNDD